MTAFKALLERAREPSFRVWATGSPFETKDVLKARQYRWESEARCWYRDLRQPELENELDWIKNAVFAGKSVTIAIDVLDARDRYSDRTGKRERRGL